MSQIMRVLASKRLSLALLLTSLCFSISGVAFGQVLSGSIVGNVTDASGAVVPGAQVTIRDLGTNQTRTTTTNDSGVYSFESIPPATYEVKVTQSGFSPTIQSGVVVSVNSVARADVKLQLGSVSQTITVAASAAQLQTDTADVHAELSSVPLENLPLPPGRNYQSLFVMLPGFSPPQSQVSIPGNPTRSLLFTANGSNEEGIVTRIDGATSTNIWRPNAVAYIPSLEAVQTVNTVTDAFTAENGTAGGAVVNVTVKSGTNAIHGSAFEYYDGSATEARPYFLPTNQSKGNLVENQFGGTIGGPIKKDKLFYFVSYEGSRNHQLEQGGLVSIPTPAMRTGDLSASPTIIYDPATGNPNGTGRTPFLNNQIPMSRIPYAIQQILKLWPSPTLSGSQNNYYASGPFHLDRNTVDAKVNWVASPKLQTFIRYGYLHYGTYNGQTFGDALGGAPLQPVGGQSGQAKGATYSVTGSATYIKSPSLVFDTYFGYTLTNGDSRQDGLDKNIGLDVLQIPGTNGPYWFEGGWPQFTISNFASIGAPNTFEPDILSDPEYEWVFNAGWTHGAHSMRFGVDISRQDLNELQVQPFGGGGQFGAQGGFSFAVGQTTIPGAKTSEYNAFASFLLGAANTLGTSVLNPPNEYALRSWQDAAYAQDQWQVNSKLTITYGLRWQYYPMPTRATRGVEFYDVTSNQTYICGYALIPKDCGIKMSKKLFEPRIGIAYRLSSGFVVRAGYGISHDPYNLLRQFRVNYPLMISENITAPNTYTPAGYVQNGIPAVTEPAFGNGIIPIPGNVAAETILPANWKRGYTQSWNLTIQKGLGHGWTAQAGYVGTREVDQLSEINLNAGSVGGGAASEPLNQMYGRTASTVAEGPVGTYKYDALQASVQHRFSRGYELGVNYTLSKSLGFAGSTNNDGTPLIQAPGYYHLNYGLTPIDRRHNLEINNVLDLPFGKDKLLAKSGIASAILGGWRINALFSYYTGSLIQVSAPGTALNAPGSTQRADLVGPIQKLGGIGSGHPYYSTSSFAQVTQPRFGNFPFYQLTGPPTHPINMGLARTFSWERLSMQFRVEAYNLLNSPDFAAPSGSVGSSSFMIVNNVQNTGREGIDQRMFRFGLRLAF